MNHSKKRHGFFESHAVFICPELIYRQRPVYASRRIVRKNAIVSGTALPTHAEMFARHAPVNPSGAIRTSDPALRMMSSITPANVGTNACPSPCSV